MIPNFTFTFDSRQDFEQLLTSNLDARAFFN